MKLLAIGTYTERTAPAVTATQELGKGIFLYPYEEISGTIGECLFLEETLNPSYLAFFKDRLFAVSETDDAAILKEYSLCPDGTAPETDSGMTGFTLRLTAKLSLPGAASCHIAVCEERELLFLSDYGSGDFHLISIRTAGALKLLESRSFTGHGARPDRQEAPHIHSCCLCGEKVFVADLGCDRIRLFAFHGDELTELEALPARAGSGPRHMCTKNQDGRLTLYVVNELDCTISVFQQDPSGRMQEIQWLPLYRGRMQEDALAADIALSQDGFLYVSVRGSNRIFVFQIQKNGTLSMVQERGCGGKGPRSICLDESGRHLLVANQASGEIVVFDLAEGMLAGIAGRRAIPVPVKVTMYHRI